MIEREEKDEKVAPLAKKGKTNSEDSNDDQDYFRLFETSQDDVDFDGKLINDDLIPSYFRNRFRTYVIGLKVIN